MSTPTADRAEQLARELLDTKVNTIRALADRAATATQAREQLDEAERAHATAYREATHAGWTDTELRKIGLSPSKRRAPGRPRKPRNGNDPHPTQRPDSPAGDSPQ